MQAAEQTYTMRGGPKGLPLLGMVGMKSDQLGVLARNAVQYGDIIPFHALGSKVIQLNHPGLIHHVLVDNHRNYQKGRGYIRFESILGKGLFTGNGETWKRDRQAIQPLFKRELVEGYLSELVGEVSERYKRRWLTLTANGPVQLDVMRELSSLTLEITLSMIFGRHAATEEAVALTDHAFTVFLKYLKLSRLIPKVDLHKTFRTPAYFRFARERLALRTLCASLLERSRREPTIAPYSMAALLLGAQKAQPELFPDEVIIDEIFTMIFGGYETTSILMQWMWYALDEHPGLLPRLREEIVRAAPCTATENSTELTNAMVERMDYLGATMKETMRMHPPFWVIGRVAVEDDRLGDYCIKRGSVVLLPQIVMHRHPRWWSEPNAFVPERFLPEHEGKLQGGLYFPFSHGPRKCIGYRLAEIEAKTVFAKFLPLFDITMLNAVGNRGEAGITYKLRHSLLAEIRRR
jgi:cytochrome P450